MKNYKLLITMVLCSMIFCLVQVHAANTETPAVKPEKFAPGIISTSAVEVNIAFSPDGNSVYFTRSAGITDSKTTIYVSHWVDNKWSNPQVAPFSGVFSDSDPFISPDGSRFYFTSRRPTDGIGEQRTDMDIWVMDKKGEGWSEPRNLGGVINTSKNEVHPSVAADGTLYYASSDTSADWNIYYSSLSNGEFGKPVKLSSEINSTTYDFNPFIDPDKRYLIFARFNYDRGDDLFISYKKGDGWSAEVELPIVNTMSYETAPFVSPDRRKFYFVVAGDIYWIDLSKLGIN